MLKMRAAVLLNELPELRVNCLKLRQCFLNSSGLVLELTVLHRQVSIA